MEILIPHPKYVADRGDLVNDIAILQVSEKFSLAPHVDTICLPPPGQTFEGSSCAATGWGKDRFGELIILLFDVKDITSRRGGAITDYNEGSLVRCS